MSTAQPGPGVIELVHASRWNALAVFVIGLEFFIVPWFFTDEISPRFLIFVIPALVFFAMSGLMWRACQYVTRATCERLTYSFRSVEQWSVLIAEIDVDSGRYSALNRWLTFRTRDGAEYRWLIPITSDESTTDYVRSRILGRSFTSEIGELGRKQVERIHKLVCDNPDHLLDLGRPYGKMPMIGTAFQWELAIYTIGCTSIVINSLDALMGNVYAYGFVMAGVCFLIGSALTLRRLRFLEREGDILTWDGTNLHVKRANGTNLVLPNVAWVPPQSATRSYQEFVHEGRVYRVDRSLLVPVDAA